MPGAESEWIYGRNPVNEMLRAGRRRVERLQIAEGARERGVLEELVERAKSASIPVQRVERVELDRLHANHQGVMALASKYPMLPLEALLDAALTASEPPFLLLLDVLQDPQNLGTLMRTAEAVGVHGVVLPRRRGVGVTPAVVSASSGACEHLNMASANIAQAMRIMKEAGLWIVGLENEARAISFMEADLSGGIGLVVGSEGEGLRRLVAEGCDWLVRLPMRGKIGSLNASVAGSVMLYHIWRARGFGPDGIPSDPRPSGSAANGSR